MKPLRAMEGLTFGCDPEVFIVDPDGQFVSAEGIIPGTKDCPHPVAYGAVQVDGMAAEFNIEPVSTFEDFERNITTVLAQLVNFLPDEYDIAFVPSVEFSEEVFDAASERAKELGCDPDFDAWTGDVNPPPDTTPRPRLRTAAGHLHIGWTQDASPSDPRHVLNCRDLVKQLDWFVGAWSATVDPDITRRRLYGKAGAMRYKPYGVEYRVLSNFWVKDHRLRLEVWNRMQKAIYCMKDSYLPDKASAQDCEDLFKLINHAKFSQQFLNNHHFPISTLNNL